MTETKLTSSYAYTGSNTPLIWSTIGSYLKEISNKYPTNDALVAVQKNIRYSYREFYEKCEKVAKGLMKIGFKRGDRISILATNYPEWVLAQFSTALIGAVLVTVNPSFKEHELEYLLKDSESQGFILIKGFKSSDYVEMFTNICPEIKTSEPGKINSKKLPNLKNVIYIGAEDQPGMMNWNELEKLGNDVSDEDLLNRQSSLDPDDVVNMQYTSGTTGFPKGVCLTHHNILNNGFFVGENMEFTDKDRLCIPVPFFHCFGMVLGNLACITHGATMVLPSEYFDVPATLKAVDIEKCTALHGVPTMFIAELSHKDFGKYNMSSLRTGIMAGAPCPMELMKEVIAKMNMEQVTICYGLTECSPVTNQTKVNDPLDLKTGTVGAPIQNIEVKIIDSDGKVMPIGEQGELCMRGYQVMRGYYNKPKETADTVDSNGWLHSGDLGVMDENGYCKITGRIKDMIIRGGENIYPREIEEFLYTNPKIQDAQAFGVPSERFGEEVAVWIKLNDGDNSTEDEMKEFCKGKIAHYKVPKYFKFVSTYPMTASGKIRKVEMRDMFSKELGLKK